MTAAGTGRSGSSLLQGSVSRIIPALIAMSADLNFQIDDAILAVARKRWQKVAMIIATIVQRRNEEATDEEYDLVGLRIIALVDNGRLEGRGNLSDWRHSEVRLRRSEPEPS
jgi:uncharacterized protein DUF3658